MWGSINQGHEAKGTQTEGIPSGIWCLLWFLAWGIPVTTEMPLV